MSKLSNNDVVVKSMVELKQHKEFNLTGIKVELEAQLNRDSTVRPDVICPDEEHCYDCEGNGNNWCDDCTEEGYSYCPEGCEDGYFENDEGDQTRCPNEDCDMGTIPCPNEECEEGSISCESCSGRGTRLCEDCEENDGVTTHNSPARREQGEWHNITFCQDYILKQLKKHGLAKTNMKPDGTKYNDRYGKERPTGALSYIRFYRDGSVDSEVTFTIKMDKAENALMIPKVIEAWNKMVEAIGNPVNVTRAGMHMAFLHGENAVYPVSSSNDDIAKFVNFRKATTQLLPALYFLGASDERSRELGFRKPQIRNNDKYSAIYYIGSAVEFRLFDTCYERPEQALDNLVVMKNCMRYWSSQYKSPNLHKITKEVKFGVEGNQELKRFYRTHQHIDLLNKGLERIKPSYYTVKELKKQRKFDLSKRTINKKYRELEEQAKKEHVLYEKQFAWDVKYQEVNKLALAIDQLRYRALSTGAGEAPTDEMLREARDKAQNELEIFKKQKQALPDYIKRKIKSYNDGCGSYRLVLEEETPQPRPQNTRTATTVPPEEMMWSPTYTFSASDMRRI